mgnify:CR=1 FL=1
MIFLSTYLEEFIFVIIEMKEMANQKCVSKGMN